jgi:gliding motility-associated-like protein
MLNRTLYIIVFLIFSKLGNAQCPQVVDYLGNLSSNPYFINCQGTGSYNMNIVSNSNWGSYTITWGDGTANNVGSSYAANSLINHIYNSATPDTFVITISIPSQGCTLTGVTVMEKPVNASIQIPAGGVSATCVSKALSFVNSSSDVSETTVFTWDFGDGSPTQTFNFSNAGQTISHNYLSAIVNCQTSILLTAHNYCNVTPSVANFNPVNIYDKDDAVITPSAFIKCWPDNIFTFTNSTNRNCVPQGNTFQRQEKWNLGNYWGMGYDSIINWNPWPPTTPLVVAYLASGTYTVQLLDSNLCGVDRQVQSITIFNSPTAALVAPSGPLCQGAPITFTNTSAPGFAYKWNFGTGGGFVSKPFGSQTFTYSTAGIFTISVVALIPGGGAACTDTEKVVINILPQPTADFKISPNKGCNSIIGANFIDLSINAVSWNWDLGNSNTSNVQVPPPQNYNSIGTFVASLTVTAANTCVNSFTAPVSVFQMPVAAFTSSASCAGSSTLFNDASTSAIGDPITSWSWDFGDASSTSTSIIQNPSHTYSLQNTYTVRLVASTAECTDTIVQSIIVNVKPTANFTATPINGCPTLTVNFLNTSVNATSYSWNFGNGNTSVLANPTETFTNTTTTPIIYTVNLVATTLVGCTDTFTAEVRVYEQPTASFTLNPSAGCSPFAAVFNNNSLAGIHYQWDFGDLSSDTANTSLVLHNYVNSTQLVQTYTPTLVVTSSNGCKDSTSLTVTVYPKPVFNYSLTPNSGCSPFNVTFPSFSGALTYQWDFGDGSPLDFSTNPTHSFTNSTTVDQTYTVQLIASNAFSCLDTVYQFPVVYAKPIANFALSQTVSCSPLNVSCINTSSLATSYLWKYGDGNTDVSSNPNYTYVNNSNTSNQSYTCTLLVTNSNGCIDSISNTVLVLFNPKANFTVDTPGCSAKLLTFTNTSVGGSTYNWEFGINTFTNSSVSQVYTNTTTANITNTVQLITTSVDNCTDTIVVPIIIHPKPEFIITALPDSGCSALNVNFPTITNVLNYQWNFGDGNLSSSNNPSNTFTNNSQSTQIYTVELIGFDVHGCADTAQKLIKVFNKPNASFQTNLNLVYIPTNPVIFSNSSSGASIYYWNFGDENNSVETNPSYIYQNAGEYQPYLIATSAAGCADTFYLPSKITAKLESSIDVPNAFSPNPNASNGGTFGANDLNNDVFHPQLQGISEYELTIFSRWGELLFVSKDVTIGWDGYYKGKLCLQDVYVWKILATTFEGDEIKKTGDLLLLR